MSITDLLARARVKWESMSDAEKKDMLKTQAKSWVRAEANWPKPRFKTIRGVKVYEAYEEK